MDKIIEIIIFQICFLALYELLFRRETFFNLNRAYLILTSGLSIILPFVKIPILVDMVPNVRETVVNTLPTVFLSNKDVGVLNNLPKSNENFELISRLKPEIIWSVGVVLFLVVFAIKLVKLLKQKQANASTWDDKYLVVKLKESFDAFSFFNLIFIGDQIKGNQKKSVLEHEKVHSNELHSIDIIWFEICRIVFWFNPFVYIYHKRIKEVHEFIADGKISKQNVNYCEHLIANTFQIQNVSLVNQFYSSSLIKKRIIMLTKQKSKQSHLIKYLLIIPLTLLLLSFVSKPIHQKSDNQVIKDVIGIVEEVLPNPKYEENITDEEVELLIKKLDQYEEKNQNLINSSDLTKYFKVHNVYSTTIQKDFQNMNEDQFKKAYEHYLVVFAQAERLSKDILENRKKPMYVMGTLKFAMERLRSKHINGRLKELNYILPEEEKLFDKYRVVNQFDVNTTEIIESVPFSQLDQSPIYPGCDKSLSAKEQKKCFSNKVAQHVNANFNIKIADELKLVGRQRLAVMFKIDKKGNIIGVKARAPHQKLEEEAKRVVNLLPKMKPGKHKGKKVEVSYSLPIIFQLNQ